MNEINKIKEIDKMLQDDLVLENYIKKIKEKQIEMPSNLKEKIISKVNRKKKKYYIDICKIAACLIFSLVICRTDFIRNDDIKRKEVNEQKETISVNQTISNICKWLTTPLDFKKEEK